MIRPSNLITSNRDKLCYGVGRTLTCVDSNLSTTEAVPPNPLVQLVTANLVIDPYLSNDADGVGWRDQYGSVSYLNFATRVVTPFQDVRSPNFKVAAEGQIAALSYQSLTSVLVGSAIRVNAFQNILGATDFSMGKTRNNSWSCAVLDGGQVSCTYYQCVPGPGTLCNILTAYEPLASFTTLVSGVTSPPALDLLAGLYIANSTATFIGVGSCYGAPENQGLLSSCSMYSPSQLESISTVLIGKTVTQVAVGGWGGCAVYNEGSLSCWSTATYALPPWEAFQSVTYVQVNDTGGCVQYVGQDSLQYMQCWPTFFTNSDGSTGSVGIKVDALQSLSSEAQNDLLQPLMPCSKSDILDNNLCIPCPYGYYLNRFNLPDPNCTQCYANCMNCSDAEPARGSLSNACFACTDGSQTSEDRSSCEACPPNAINSQSAEFYFTCQECPPGFQANTDRTACEACPANTTREPGALQCHTCSLPSFLSLQTVPCQTCVAPQYPSFTSALTYTCVACPVGEEPNLGGSCTECVAPFIRNSTQASCTICPPGTEAATPFQCTSCTGNSFRQIALKCWECPKGSVVNAAKTSCIDASVQKLGGLSNRQTVFMGVGVLFTASVLAASVKLSKPQLFIGILLGLSIVAGGYFLP
jgi:hypothetical protein